MSMRLPQFVLICLALLLTAAGGVAVRQQQYLAEDRATRLAVLEAFRDGRPLGPGQALRVYADYFTPADLVEEPSIAQEVTRDEFRAALRAGPYRLEEPSLGWQLWEGFTNRHSTVLRRAHTGAIVVTATGQQFYLGLESPATPGVLLVTRA